MKDGFSIGKPQQRRWWQAAGILCLWAGFAHAETVVLKSGQSGTGTAFRRQNNSLVFLMELRGPDGKPVMGPDGKAAKAERSVAIAEIEKVEAETPAVLKTAPALLRTGKAAQVLPELAKAAKAVEAFGDLPGSWWPQLVALQAQTLIALGKDAEASTLAGTMEASGSAALARDGKAVRALIAARKGDQASASALLSPLWKEKDTLQPGVLAAISVARGFGFLEKKQSVPALKAFLELPVFLPDETALSAIAELGAAQAYFGLEDYDRAIATLENLMKTQPDLPEAAMAKTFLPLWQQRRTAVAEAKAP